MQCGAVRLCHFADDFGAIFTIYAVYAILWTPLVKPIKLNY